MTRGDIPLTVTVAFGILSTALDVVTITLAVIRRRGVYGTLAWIFAILAIPMGGAMAYLLLANPQIVRTTRVRVEARRRIREAKKNARRLLANDTNLTTHERSILTLAGSLTGFAATRGNHLEILTDNAATFERIEQVIRNASERVWAEYYIVEDDATGRRFLELLTARAKDGLDVRLLMDAVGSAGVDRERVRELERAGGKVAVFHPVNPLRRRWAIHLRNHRKILVVDGKIGLTGGMNIGDVYSGGLLHRRKPKGRIRAWRDTQVLLEGPAVHDLAEVFAEDWCFATDDVLELTPPPEPENLDSGFVAIVPSGPDQTENASGLTYFAGIALSERRCFVTSPYFIPDEATQKALATAALRGVDVRVLVPAKNDVLLMEYAMRSYYAALLEAGVRIFEYTPCMLHAKTMVVDTTWATVGSANVDVRSFRLNFELGAVVFDEGFARAMEGQFFKDLEQSREVKLSDLRGRPAHDVVLEGLAHLLSPLL